MESWTSKKFTTPSLLRSTKQALGSGRTAMTTASVTIETGLLIAQSLTASSLGWTMICSVADRAPVMLLRLDSSTPLRRQRSCPRRRYGSARR